MSSKMDEILEHIPNIRRVCYSLQDCYRYGNRNNFEQWLQKYGHYVRLVKPLLSVIRHLEAEVDWLKYVNRATRLTAFLYSNSPDNVGRLTKYLQQIKTLRIIDLVFDSCHESLPGMVEIAKAINELELISHIRVQLPDNIKMTILAQWTNVIEFVETLHSSKQSKLVLEINFDDSVTAQQVRTLAPYLAKLYAVDNRFTSDTTYRNRDIISDDFASAAGTGTEYALPRLEYIMMEICCLHPQFYDFKDVTPTCAPRLCCVSYSARRCTSCRLEQINIYDNGLIWKSEFNSFAHVVVPSHHWPNLVHLRIGTISSERLMNIIGLNPQLQYLTINPGMDPDKYTIWDREIFTTDNFNHDVFKIDKILEKLPHLRTLTIAKLYAAIDAELGSIPPKRHRDITVEIGSQMAATPAAINYLLQMQQLTELQFHQFAFTDVDETIKLLRDSAGSCGARSFTWHPIEWNQELALAMTAKMPKLAKFSTKQCPENYRAVFKEKCSCSF
ncbi:hypothetical protein GQ42DRAFT_170801 [Ramicandelaber brevisporus]|nr:hypothetical protein GQ42DRAFT_170801 [Ramicandelaber brevisporus]